MRWGGLLVLAIIAAAGYGVYTFYTGFDAEQTARDEFIAKVKKKFKKREDRRWLNQFGYPDSFISHKMKEKRLKKRADVHKLFTGYKDHKAEKNVDVYHFVVGKLIDEEVRVFYDNKGEFERFENTGPSLGVGKFTK